MNSEESTDEHLLTGIWSTADVERVGRYRIEKLLGRSGIGGAIHLAVDDELNRQVSIEVSSHLPEQATRFLAEALAFAKFHHPHLVPIYDIGRNEEGRHFVVSRFIDGVMLSRRVRDEEIDCDEATKLMATIAETLEFTHQRGLMHGNLCPNNVLLENITGTPFVTGFVIPNSCDDDLEGAFFGKPYYFSPEQIEGELNHPDRRSDVYSLGVVFYRLLTGKIPFQGSISELIDQIKSADPVSPRKRKGNIPVELERICLKAMAKRPSDRYSTAAEMANDLRRWQTSSKWRWLPGFGRPWKAS